jgi:UDP-N-acetylmuramoyl-L-alanyl-D-glutamate--2,6-diaminopimelate ligase
MTAAARQRTVADLLAGEMVPPPALAALPVRGLRLDSRELQPGEAFVALRGSRGHGLEHLEEARRRGAACILFEPPAPEQVVLPVEALAIDDLRARLGRIADRWYGAPSRALTVVGVTGTNGKTSTVQLLAQALEGSPLGPCGSIGTLGVGLGGRFEAGERTTPDVVSVHAALAGLQARGARSVAMEVSSHALDQGRVDAVAFDVAAFTNLSRDHLDYHGSMQAYGAAKARLLQWPRLAAIVLNIDDAFGRAQRDTLAPQAACWTVSSRGDRSARLRAEAVRLDGDGIGFELVEQGERWPVRSRLLGRFNVDNLLAVAGCLRALGFDGPATAARLQASAPVPGRMTRLGGGGQPLVVVDYAHTPDALAQALASLREHARGRLLCVFGCGGERDAGKRPQMAQAAERLADAVVVTDDNPRSEAGDAIVADILAGFAAPQAVTVQRDRAAAIADALDAARPGDVVLIAGKGHETYQDSGGHKRPFDDAAVAAAWLSARGGR